MQITNEIKNLFEPLIGQKAWGASLGWGSFVTIEFGSKRLFHGHYHGEWHLWLYMCEWKLNSNGRLLADSESKKKVMQVAIENLNGTELTGLSFNSQDRTTEFTFNRTLHLGCKPYPDSSPKEECWVLFLPNRQVASLREAGLKYEVMDREAGVASRK